MRPSYPWVIGLFDSSPAFCTEVVAGTRVESMMRQNATASRREVFSLWSDRFKLSAALQSLSRLAQRRLAVLRILV